MLVTKAIDKTTNFFIIFPLELLFVLTRFILAQNINQSRFILAYIHHYLYYQGNQSH
jgi:hypothetical protein